jgi:hypothetical protein
VLTARVGNDQVGRQPRGWIGLPVEFPQERVRPELVPMRRILGAGLVVNNRHRDVVE